MLSAMEGPTAPWRMPAASSASSSEVAIAPVTPTTVKREISPTRSYPSGEASSESSNWSREEAKKKKRRKRKEPRKKRRKHKSRERISPVRCRSLSMPSASPTPAPRVASPTQQARTQADRQLPIGTALEQCVSTSDGEQANKIGIMRMLLNERSRELSDVRGMLRAVTLMGDDAKERATDIQMQQKKKN